MIIEVTDDQLKDPAIKHIVDGLLVLLSPTSSEFDFEKLYQLYPLKRGKEPGMTKLKKRIKTQAEYSQFEQCVLAYAAEVSLKPPAEKKYTMLFSTFVNGRYKDYLPENAAKETPAIKWTFK